MRSNAPPWANLARLREHTGASSRIAVAKAKNAGLSLKGSAICSGAFIPFPDGQLAAGDDGVTCAIQPGGSMKDPDVIAAANERGMALILTGTRHFRH